MAGAKEYGTDTIVDVSYELHGSVVTIGGVPMTKHKSPNGFPRYKRMGTGCSGTGCTFFTELVGAEARNAYTEHRKQSHLSFTDDETEMLLSSIYLYVRNPDYTQPPEPFDSHGNKGKRRVKQAMD